jgi:hypothetical protein
VKSRRLWQCKTRHDHAQFTLKTGTIFEDSPISLDKWLLAMWMLANCKNGVSSYEIHRATGISQKSTWFMLQRIRLALQDENLGGKLSGEVEVDETYIGGKARNRKNHIPPKEPVLSLVERGGRVRSRHVPSVNGRTLGDVMDAEIDKTTYIMTDESPIYPSIAKGFSGHGTVNHSIEEYVRAYFWHTNTAEGYFSILKRGIVGTYHHVSEQHLKRYLCEFDFRYNERAALEVTDEQRATKAVKGVVGKRLTYKLSDGRQAQEEAPSL